VDSRLVNDIKQSEGLRLTAYKDSLGFWTIGYGHLLSQDKDWVDYKITQEQADTFLDDDLSAARQRCMHLLEWRSLDTTCRQNAVIELEFNMAGKWIKFQKTRFYLSNEDWKEAHDELLNSLWAKQVGPERSNRIANYLLTGQY
jgi:lysozyme